MTARGAARAGGEPPRQIALITALMLLLESSLYSVMAPLLPHYAHSLGLSKGASGALVASYAAGLLVGASSGPLIAKRASVKGAAAIGVAMFGACSVGFGLARSVALLDLMRAAQGAGGGLMWLAGLTWVVSVVPAERQGSAIGATFSVAIFGTLIGPLLGTLALAVGVVPVFCALGAVSAVLLAALLATPGPVVASPGSPAIGLLARARAVHVPIGLIVLVACAVGAFNALVPLLLDSLGVGHLAIGAVFLAGAVVATVGSPLTGRIVDRGERWGVARVLLAACVLLTALMAAVHGAAPLAGVSVLAVAAWPLLSVPLATIISGEAERARVPAVAAMSWLTLSWSLGELIGAPAGSLLAQIASYSASFAVLAGTALVALLAVSSSGGLRIFASRA